MSSPLPPELQEALSSSPGQRSVVMTCGIAGSGKSTLAKNLVSQYPNFQRLSIDSYIFTHHGLAGIDCPVPQYSKYQAEARVALKLQFREILREGERDVVLDFSFWNREHRDEWRGIVSEETRWDGNGEDGKVKVVLVYLDAEEEVLWRRIEGRRVEAEKNGKGADDAVVVTRAMLGRYARGFERPEQGEAAITVNVK